MTQMGHPPASGRDDHNLSLPVPNLGNKSGDKKLVLKSVTIRLISVICVQIISYMKYLHQEKTEKIIQAFFKVESAPKSHPMNNLAKCGDIYIL